MTKTYNIYATFTTSSQHQYVRTAEGYQNAANHDALAFQSESDALSEFHNTEAADLVRFGWEGYHTITLTVVEYTVDADDEVHTREVAEKTITVDTTEAA